MKKLIIVCVSLLLVLAFANQLHIEFFVRKEVLISNLCGIVAGVFEVAFLFFGYKAIKKNLNKR